MTLNEENIDYYQSFFGSNYEYWTKEAVQLEMQGKTSFNLYAFFFGLFWFLYRKMFREVVVIVLVVMAVRYLEAVLILNEIVAKENELVLSMCTTLGLSSLFGLFANKLYLRHCHLQVTQILAGDMEANAKIEVLKNKGGISYISPIILLILMIVVNTIAY